MTLSPLTALRSLLARFSRLRPARLPRNPVDVRPTVRREPARNPSGVGYFAAHGSRDRHAAAWPTPTPPTTSQAYTVPSSTGRATVESTRAASIQTISKEPTVTPELIGILAMGGTLAGLMLALWRDTRADIQNLRAEVRADLGDLRKDVQSLTERTSRLEGVIEGLFGGRPRDRHDDAA